MRISGGQFKNKKLLGPPESAQTRPLPSVVKEALFNLLRGHWEGARILDGFAGTGSFGLEAISRGAEHVVFFEKDRRVASVLEKNARAMGVLDRCEIVTGDALSPAALARCPRPADIVFFDPPYPLVRDPEQWGRVSLAFSRLIDRLADTGFACLRTPAPFYHVVPDDQPVPGRPEAREPEVVVIEGESMVEMSDEELEALDEADDWAEFFEAPGKKPVRRVDVPLKLDNADGPETHTYRHTALHLYMKKGCG